MPAKSILNLPRDKNLVVTYVCNSAEDMQSQTSFIRRNLFLYVGCEKSLLMLVELQ